MENFQSLGLPESIMHSLTEMKFDKPTPIQAQAIPLALQGHDILGSAQTGTGKTAAFGIPLITHLINNPASAALILTPTRELAMQVLETLRQILGRKTAIHATLLIGGEPIFKQLKQLQRRPSLIVGTPGRINDHLDRGSLKLNNADFVVFDETDRMLDMGFSAQLQQIAKHLPAKRQSLLFSATMAPAIVKVAQSYLNNPQRISVGSTTSPTENIKQEMLRTSDAEKYDLLLKQLDLDSGSFIVFVKTKFGTEKLATRLRKSGHEADAIHGDLRQRNREQVIRAFRDRKHRILVATDVAARGLDIPHIECVVNYDLPQCPEDYIHRIGRTGRAGAMGKAVSLVTSQDSGKWKDICRLLNPADTSAGKFERSEPRSSAPRGNPRGGQGGWKGRSASGDSRGPARRDDNRGSRGPAGEGAARPAWSDSRGPTRDGTRGSERRDDNRGNRAGAHEGTARPAWSDRGPARDGAARPAWSDRGPARDGARGPARPDSRGDGRGPRGPSAGKKPGGFRTDFKKSNKPRNSA